MPSLTPYRMHTFELIIEHSAPDSVARARDALTAIAQPGWTETESVGYWHGQRAEQTTFTVYADVDLTDKLADVLLYAHRHDSADGVYQLTCTDMDGRTTLNEVRA